jgi:hypothetical protein
VPINSISRGKAVLPFYLAPFEWIYEEGSEYVSGYWEEEGESSNSPTKTILDRGQDLVSESRDAALETTERISDKIAEEARNAAIFGPAVLAVTAAAVAVALDPGLRKKLF